MNNYFQSIIKPLSSTNRVYYDGNEIPRFPPDAVQIRTTGRAGVETLKEALYYYEDCLEIYKKLRTVNKENDRLLDFGVGWGRILRFFMKDFNVNNLIGVDVKTDLIKICNEIFTWGNFIQSQAFPPINLDSESVDFITGYSVFSHLSEEASLEWIKEFYRILRPGGIVTVTTRGIWFLNYIQKLDPITSPYAKALSTAIKDYDEARSLYDKGNFLHVSGSGISGSGELNETFYGETWISEKYAKRKYSEFFKVHDFVFTEGRSTHPIMVLEKK